MRSIAKLLPLALLALPFTACSSDKNHAERAEAAATDPANAPIDYFDIEALKTACIGACKEDPGSKAVDVAKAEAGYQFAWLWALAPVLTGGEGKAWATFTYDDNTTDFVLPIRTDSTTGYGRGGWEPPSEPVPAGQGPAWATRFRGGPFTEYGGGFGMSLRSISNYKDVRSANPSIALLEETPSAEYPDPSAGAYDLSTYEGVAIWVRRGPDGQSTMRLGITERNSGEDLNSSAIRDADPANADKAPPGIVEGKYCKRWRYCGCSGGTPCSPVPGRPDKHVCYDPTLETPTATELDNQIKYPHCGTTRCQDKNSSTVTPDPDPLFWKDFKNNGPAMCSPSVQSDGHTDMFCFDPAIDPAPPAKRERCNNPFSRPITVSTDWQLIKVPFTELRQADEANVANDMDLHSVKQFVVTYGAGWIDFWVANVGFYKKL